MIRYAVIAALALGLAGCAATGEKLDQGLAKLGMPTVFESPGEKQTIISGVKPAPYQVSSLAVGEQKDLARRRGEGLGFVRVATLERYLDEVRRKVSAKAGVTGVPGKVIILANPAYAAHSTPDGNIYLAMGWAPYLESEDEVAAIIAHELSHVLLTHHTADLVTQTQKRGQALHELGVVIKMALNKTTAVNEDDQEQLTSMRLLTDLVDKVGMPVWERRQEREADLLAIDLLVRAGYSPIAMTTMLEKFRASEKETKESDEEFQKRAGEVAQKDFGQAVALAWKKLVDKVSSSHPDTGQRIDDVAAYLDRHYGDTKMPDPKAAPWKAVRGKPDVKEVMQNYGQAFRARKALDQQKPKEAYAQAKSAATGRTANDAYPNWVLAQSAVATGRQKEAVAALQRAISSNEPVREIYDDMIRFHERGAQLENALAWTNKASAVFGETERWAPTKIRLLRKLNRADEAGALTLKCTVETPDLRQECQKENQTPALRPRMWPHRASGNRRFS